MLLKCAKCGAALEKDWPVCRSCFEPVKREGFLTRLARFFSGGGASSTGSRVLYTTRQETFKIRDAATGELREYHSIDEVPEEFREQLRKAREQAQTDGTTLTSQSITVTDASGKVHTYHSIEELPPELRELYQKALRQK
jgi:hypothetical protein